MVRPSQTAGAAKPRVYHTQAFTDHAGRRAFRVRRSDFDEPIPSNFHAEPTFNFQIYLAISLDLETPKAGKQRGSDAEKTALTDIVVYLGAMVSDAARRPEPMWEVYPEQLDVFECVEHQRREIAHRKAKRWDSSIPPIPLVEKTGFLFIVDSLDFKFGIHPVECREIGLWVTFERRFPAAISWEPRHRLNGDPQAEWFRIDGTREMLKVLPHKVDAEFTRIQLRLDDLHDDLGELYGDNCHVNEPPGPVQEVMDVGWDVDEGKPDDDLIDSTRDTMDDLSRLAAGMVLEDFNIFKPADNALTISNFTKASEPDLRYAIYVPFLQQPERLEHVAKAFTQQMSLRLVGKKTFCFEFYTPPSRSLSAIISMHREKYQTEGYIGALTTFPSQSSEENSSSIRIRAHPIDRRETQYESADTSEIYRTFCVILEKPEFAQPGRVKFLLTDPILGGRDADFEMDTYSEIEVWRCTGLDDVAKRLQMDLARVQYEGPIP
ncbi:hypothetical protein B0A50_04793 [Salinomyces thailandicus]|uniref:Uncharacterized protein n=1 Tax=Salinomyces thailandicus TaxID=706561 RepID=A0A4U0TY35_9PEZI|nr:hypothetical protein B0A50_04793 [Salinomyces thailandica]